MKNNIFKQEHIEALYQERLSICNQCEFAKEKGLNDCAIPGTAPCCPECGCSFALKLRAPDVSCPKDKWQAVMTSQEVSLLNINLHVQDNTEGREIGNEGNQSDLQNGVSTSEG